MSERNYYVICDDNCKFEGMTKEQIYDAIAEATGSTPTPVDEAFITKVKEQNANHNIKFWKGTEAQYNALTEKDTDTVYFVGGNKLTDTEQLEETLDQISETLENRIDQLLIVEEVTAGGGASIPASSEGIVALTVTKAGYTAIAVAGITPSAEYSGTKTSNYSITSFNIDRTQIAPFGNMETLKVTIRNRTSNPMYVSVSAQILYKKN